MTSGEPPPTPDLALLRSQPFFEGLSDPFLSALVPSARLVGYDTGATIAREGDPAREFCLILQGKVALELVPHDRPRLTVLTLGPGEVFGWSWLVAPHLWRSDARALKPTRVLGVDGERLRNALEAHPSDGYRFLLRFVPVLGQRLDATRWQVLDVHRP